MRFNIPGRGFLQLVKAMLTRCLKGRPKLVLAILGADTISVTSRLMAVLILSAMANVMKNDGIFSFRDYDIFISDDLFTQGLWAALAMIMCLLLSAFFGFIAVFLARKLARWMNEQMIDDVMLGLTQSPEIAIQAPYSDPNIFNRLLTQNAIHCGMMAETILRMANPIVMFTLAWGVVFIQSPPLAIGIVVFVILFLPIFFRLFVKTQSVARDFYADSAQIMGQGVSQAVLSLNPQYGVFTGPHNEKMVKHVPYMRDFLGALDSNILANERIGLLVGIIGALFVGFVIGVNSYLASLKAIDIAGIIALTGGFLYLVASARTVASMLTNLVRFYPQVKSIWDFFTPLKYPKPQHTNIALPQSFWLKPHKAALGKDAQSSQGLERLQLSQGGARVGLISPFPLSKFTLAKFLTPLITPGGNLETLSRNLVFVSSRYRFKAGETISTNFNSGRVELSEKSVDIAHAMNVLEEFEKLPNGLSTLMSEAVFNRLSGKARTALRLIPLMADTRPRLVLIDVAAVRNLNPATFDDVFSHFKNCIIIITMTDKACPNNLAELFIQTDGEHILGIGDRDWLVELDMDHSKPVSSSDTVVYL